MSMQILFCVLNKPEIVEGKTGPGIILSILFTMINLPLFTQQPQSKMRHRFSCGPYLLITSSIFGSCFQIKSLPVIFIIKASTSQPTVLCSWQEGKINYLFWPLPFKIESHHLEHQTAPLGLIANGTCNFKTNGRMKSATRGTVGEGSEEVIQ